MTKEHVLEALQLAQKASSRTTKTLLLRIAEGWFDRANREMRPAKDNVINPITRAVSGGPDVDAKRSWAVTGRGEYWAE
jgi:hypothetical protein